MVKHVSIPISEELMREVLAVGREAHSKDGCEKKKLRKVENKLFTYILSGVLEAEAVFGDFANGGNIDF